MVDGNETKIVPNSKGKIPDVSTHIPSKASLQCTESKLLGFTRIIN